MSIPSLPAQGSTAWYAWAQAVHNAASGALLASDVGSGNSNDLALRAAFDATHSLIRALRRGVEDQHVLIAGDSTADNAGYLTDNTTPLRWWWQLAQTLASEWPAYTVAAAQWLDASGSSTAATAAPYSWSTPTILQAGPSGLRTDTAGGSTTSSVVTDASIASGDAGKRVLGLNVPPHAFVGTVTAGTSFTLVNEQGAPVYPLGALTSIQLGADPVLYFWGAAVSGSRWLYGLGQYAKVMYAQVRPNLILANHGHNEVSGLTGATGNVEQFRQNYLAGIESLTELCPGAPVILMGQNPRFDSQAADEPIKSRVVADIAAERGYGYTDVYQRFVDHATWQADWMSNSLHPNTTGYAQWADELHKLFRVGGNQRLSPSSVQRSLFVQAPAEQLAPGGLMLDWSSSGLPPGWTASNATAVRDTATFGTTCMKITATAAGGFVQVPLDVSKVAGQWITATIRARYDIGTDPFQCGALGIHYVDANSTAVKINSTAPSTLVNGLRGGQGGWFYQSVSAYIPDGVKSAHIWLYGDLLGSSTASYVQRLVVQRGRGPAGNLPLPTPAQLVTGGVTDSYVASGAGIAPAKVSGLAPYLSALAGALFPGTAGNYYSTPSATANRITGNLEIRVKLGAGTMLRPSGQQVLVAKWAGAGSQSYRFYVATSGSLNLAWTTDGSTLQSASSGTALAATLTADTWVRVQLTASTGVVTFWTSPDKMTWTQLGSTVTAGATSIFDSTTQPVEVGSGFNGTAQNFSGVIEAAEIASTLGGAAAVSWVLPSAGATSWTATTGETWTLTGVVPGWFTVSQSMLTPADAATLAGATAPVFARKTATEGRTTTTLADDADLHVALAANATYTIDGWLRYDATTTADLLAAFTVPTGATLEVSYGGLSPSVTTPTGSIDATVVETATRTLGGAGAGTDVGASVRGIIRTGGTAGDLTLQWAQANTDATAANLYIDSWLRLQKVG